jgi:hypothetical protein
MIRSLAFLLMLPVAHASAAIGISCEQFVVDGGAVEEVCAEHQMYGPSPGLINGTDVEYIGDYVDIYNILELDDSVTAEEIEAMPGNYSEYLSGLIVQVTRFQEGGCEVTINGTACANCEVCGDNSTSVSADCSAIPGGRAVECEPLDNVYFPFEGYALANSTEAEEGGDVSTNPPTDGSTAPPVSASYRSVAAFATVVVAAVGTLLQL